ncbi:MAG: cupredoxin domain-containing protein [Paracoccaceae bacterium]
MNPAKFPLLAGVALTALALSAPVRADTQLEITLTDTAFEPAEVKVPAGAAFTVLVHNKSAAVAEIEAKDLKIEKVVAAGEDILINVRAQDAGTYLFVNEYKEDTIFGHITAE